MPDETPAPAPTTATGFKSTEFWQGMIALGVGAFLVVYGSVVADKGDLVDVGGILLLGQSLGYGAMRTVAKVRGV